MTYGPNTQAVQSIIDRIPTLTYAEVNRLGASWSAAWSAAWRAAWGASRSADWGTARSAAWYATWGAAWGAARSAARSAAWDATWGASRDALLATVTYDLATIDGPYTIAQRDLLLAPWVEVCGMPEGLVTP